MFHFIIVLLIRLVFLLFFSGEITISSTFLEFSSAGVSAALQTTFLDEVFRASYPIFVAASNTFLLYLLDRFLENDKNPYPLTYFLVIGLIE